MRALSVCVYRTCKVHLLFFCLYIYREQFKTVLDEITVISAWSRLTSCAVFAIFVNSISIYL